MREIDTAINNEQTKLRILLTNGFGVKKISEYNDLEFYSFLKKMDNPKKEEVKK